MPLRVLSPNGSFMPLRTMLMSRRDVRGGRVIKLKSARERMGKQVTKREGHTETS
jgi:hypothetical protein